MKNKKLLVGGLSLALIGVSSLAFITKPTYKTIDNTNLDTEKMAVYINDGDGNYESSTTIPTSGYILNEGKSSCNNGATPTWNSSTKNLKIKNLSSNNTSCYLYFDKQVGIPADELFANIKKEAQDIGTTFTSVETGEGGVYSATDATYGNTTYYWRGAVTNNYVVFAGKCWRIIRINGNGSIRMIFDSSTTTCKANGEGENATSSQKYNSMSNDNAYVGYMKGLNNTGTSSSYAAAHANTYNSDIKTYLDNWYDTNIAKYASYIDEEAGFCNDRTIGSSGNGYGNSGTTYYAPYDRIAKTPTNATPTLGCTRSDDLFTPSTSGVGNKILGTESGTIKSRPIGLITADEAVYAGGLYGSAYGKNSSYYLYNGTNYWAMSPYYFNGTDAWVLFVTSNGYINDSWVGNTYGVRPVINLKSTTTFTGNGEQTTPYVVQ